MYTTRSKNNNGSKMFESRRSQIYNKLHTAAVIQTAVIVGLSQRYVLNVATAASCSH